MDFMSTFGLVSYHSTPRIRFITCIWFDLVLSILIFRNNLYAKISTCLILIQQVIVFVPDSSYKLVISIYFVCITVPITSSQFDKIFRSFLLHAPPRTSHSDNCYLVWMRVYIVYYYHLHLPAFLHP